MIGAVDERQPVKALELIERSNTPSNVAETDSFTVQAVRWPVFEGVMVRACGCGRNANPLRAWLPSLMPIKLQKLWRGLRPELRRIISSRGAWPRMAAKCSCPY